MSDQMFPRFKYHPDPLATGAIEKSAATCICCGQARGFIYPGPAYAVEELFEALCPWCIQDGSAAKKFDAQFVQDLETHIPATAGRTSVSQAVADEVYHRTPGYSSWQGELWLCHCDDACEFHGDISPTELLSLPPESEELFLKDNPRMSDWPAFKLSYEPRGHVRLFKFKCRHCEIVRLGVDLS